MKKLYIAAIVMFIMLAGYPAAAAEPVCFQNAPDSELLRQVEVNLFEYRNRSGQWPRDVKELNDFARKKGTPLDLSGFGLLTLEKKSPDTVLIVYSVTKTEPYISSYAITVNEIAPPADIQSGPDTSVRQIQVLLLREGYDPGQADGKIGGKTRDAIAQFQRDNGLAVTGVPGTGLLEILEHKKLKELMKTKAWPNGISADRN